MFEFFFKYPLSAFAKGEVVLLGKWPLWVLAFAVLAAGVALAWPFWRRRHGGFGVRGARSAGVWLLQTLLVALLLLVLWQPALSIATLRPQQNIVAVVVDDSRSMSMQDGGVRRMDRVQQVLSGGLLSGLAKKFQVRLYRAGASLERIDSAERLSGAAPVTRLGDALKQVASEATSLPIGAVVLLSDGGENAGGIGLETLNEIRRQRIPIHTIGFGREKIAKDIEIIDAQLPQRTLADSRLSAQVSFRQSGYDGQKARLSLKDGNKVLASREVILKAGGAEVTESLAFNAGPAGARSVQASIELMQGEENVNNNGLTRLVGVESKRPRILYIEGEPKWEYKFLRRAIDLDNRLQLASMLRTTQNKIYRQGISNPNELTDGFPSRVEDLFGYEGIIIGGVEASYFTPAQQALLREFVDRRGGGILFLAGRAALGDGGYTKSVLADLLPVTLPSRAHGFQRDSATVELTPAGRDSLICRIDDNPERNVERWKKLPYLADYQDAGIPKAGAVVLADMWVQKRKLPLLVTQNYGRGRTAVLATSGTWRWQMSQPVEDLSHETFWQQLLRWLVSGTGGQVISSTPKAVLSDETRAPLRVEVRDKNFLPSSDARAEARVIGPGGLAETVELQPDPTVEGVYSADWVAEKPGSYVAEVSVKRGEEEVGRDVITFHREDGVAENFQIRQNRELLESLSAQTGGNYRKPEDAASLSNDIAYSEAGITTRETRDLWDMPILFLFALMLRSTEWLLRRRWGAV